MAVPDNGETNIFQDPDPFVREDWKEAVQAYAPGGGDTFSLENSEAVLAGYIPFAKRWTFIRYMLGVSFVTFTDDDDPSTYRLHRTVPQEHPWYGWMQAHSISLQYFSPDGTELKIDAFDPDIAFDFASYIKVLATVRYRQLPWQWRSDEDVSGTGEYDRMCYDPDRTGNLEILSQAAGEQLTFAETVQAPAGFKPGPPAATKFPTEIGLPIFKEQFNYKWMYVPKDYIMAGDEILVAGVGTNTFEDGYRAKHITPRLGTLNKTAFLGFPAGTLLLGGIQYERFLWPLRSLADSPYGYNVTFNFQVFDPKKGIPTSIYRGHNLMPWRDNGLFYYATYDGSLGGQPFLRSTEFRELFTYVNATDPDA